MQVIFNDKTIEALWTPQGSRYIDLINIVIDTFHNLYSNHEHSRPLSLLGALTQLQAS